MHAAAAAEHQGVDPLHQPHGVGVGVTEGHPGPRHQIEPVLEGCRYIEVVHGGADQQQVDGLEFGNQPIRQRHRLPDGLIGRFSPAQGVKQRAVEGGQVEGGQVAHHHLVLMALLPACLQEALHQLVGAGCGAVEAGLQQQDLAHEGNSI